MKNITGGSILRGLVRLVFISCYIAFLSASMHNIAYFFASMEGSTSTTIQSYASAGAFDITALVMTTAVMFFRKSMTRRVFVGLWVFIAFITLLSFSMNLEYTSHFQDLSMTLEPTGATTPVYDAQGVLHYVPVMQSNLLLVYANPVLGSLFTILSLVYSIVAEAFGTKPPTVEELNARLQYLQETEEVNKKLQSYAANNKKPSLIMRAKDVAKEVKGAVKEVVQDGIVETESEPEVFMNEESFITETDSELSQNFEESSRLSCIQETGWDAFRGKTSFTIDEAAEILQVKPRRIQTLLGKKQLQSPGRSKNRVTLPSLKAYAERRTSRIQRTNDLFNLSSLGQRSDDFELLNEHDTEPIDVMN